MEILESLWFTQMGNAKQIGVVKVKPEFGPIKFYIGEASGENQEEDEQHIAQTGASFKKDMIFDFLEF